MQKVGVLYLLVILLITGCTSSQKLLEKGRYDRAIEKSAGELRKNSTDSEELQILKEAYAQANLYDQERIEFLERENREENYYEIYQLYAGLENRQNVIRSLPTPLRSQFALIDYDEQIIEYKEDSAEALYQQGVEFLNRGDQESARLAYQEFEEVKNIYRDYKNVDQLLNEAQFLGTNFVFLDVLNNSDKVLPLDFDNELRKISLADLNTKWVQYETYPDSSICYDYNIIINIQDIEVSPERVETKSYSESKEIQEGMKYVLDENGNVKKDSLGNDIREPNIVTISAEVKESIQQKRAIVGGSIDYIDLDTDQLIETEKISVEAVFEHFSAETSGDKEALSEETSEKLDSRLISFPSNEAMLLDAAVILKEKAKSIIRSKERLLAN